MFKIDVLKQIKDDVTGILSKVEKNLLKSIATHSLRKLRTKTRVVDGGVEYIDHDVDYDNQLSNELHEIIDSY
jgi:hypothetical protein